MQRVNALRSVAVVTRKCAVIVNLTLTKLACRETERQANIIPKCRHVNSFAEIRRYFNVAEQIGHRICFVFLHAP